MAKKLNRTEQEVLQALLTIGDEKPEKTVPMKRFSAEFTLRAIDGKTVNAIREQATFTTKKGKQLDEELFGALIIEKGCVVPNWNASELVDKYGSSDRAIQSVLLSGEISKISAYILELSGFGEEEEEDEDSVKN